MASVSTQEWAVLLSVSSLIPSCLSPRKHIMEVWEDMAIFTYRVGHALVLFTIYIIQVPCGTGTVQRIETSVHVL